MIKYWNKETYNEDGVFYRNEDWGIELTELPGDNFTNKEPLGLDQKVIPKQHFDTDANEWVLDVPFVYSGVLDAHNIFTKLQIRRGLRALGDEAKLDALINASAEFKSDWSDATEIDLNDEMTQQALNQSDIDIDALKKQILEV